LETDDVAREYRHPVDRLGCALAEAKTLGDGFIDPESVAYLDGQKRSDRASILAPCCDLSDTLRLSSVPDMGTPHPSLRSLI
jgi:hypothetical protein